MEWLQGYTWGLALNVGPQGGMITRLYVRFSSKCGISRWNDYKVIPEV